VSSFKARIFVNLWGSFSVYTEDGVNITPRLKKCQALIAMLATAHDGRRSRSWLQSRLWSDRSSGQASGSLRQALAEIRGRFGEFKDIVTANRQSVCLDMSQAKLDEPDYNQEFLEGLDVRDEEFDDWLRLERAHRSSSRQLPGTFAETPPAIQSPLVAPNSDSDPVIVLSAGRAGDPSAGAIETFLIDCVARSLRENLSIPTYTDGWTGPNANALKVHITASDPIDGQLFLTANCVNSGTTELLWSGNQIVQQQDSLPFADVGLLGWLNEIVAAIAEFVGRRGKTSKESQNATHLGLSALRELFSLQSPRVEEADRMLIRAYEIDPRAIFMAWRAQLRGIQLVERHNKNSQELRDEGLMLAQAALQAEPSNSSVLATTANARLILDQDIIAAEELSRESIARNPSNPLAWWSRSFAYLYTDRIEDALQASERGHQLSKGSPYRFWWDMQVAMSACAARRHDKAIQSAERCATFSSSCRPPMRYLIALHAENGSVDRASHWARKLKALEPDFSVERLILDGDYPASLLRKYDLVQAESLKAINALP